MAKNKLELLNNIDVRSANASEDKSIVVERLKEKMPKPLNGTDLKNKIKKLGLSVPDFARLTGRSAGALNNMMTKSNEKYRDGKGNDIILEMAVGYIEKVIEEHKRKKEEIIAKEKERVIEAVGTPAVVNTFLSLQECQTLGNKSKLMHSILTEKDFSTSNLIKSTGLTKAQIVYLRGADKDIEALFDLRNDMMFDEMQESLMTIMSDNRDLDPSVAINAIRTHASIIKTKLKDKDTNKTSQTVNIINDLRDLEKKVNSTAQDADFEIIDVTNS